MSSLVLALFIVLCVGLIGAFAAFVRDRSRYAGYRDIMRDVIAFSKTVDGEIFRDGGDLVVSGEQRKVPLIVRFSHAESTPGLIIRLSAPATFAMSVFPRGNQEHGGTLVRTADSVFNTKFEVRSDQPAEAKLLLDSSRAMTALAQLCRSGQDFLTVHRGAIEFGQLGYPNPGTARSLPSHAEALSGIRGVLESMPGAELVKVEPRQRRRDYILRGTIVAGVVAVAAVLYITSHEPRAGQATKKVEQLPEGMSEADAALIGNASLWRYLSTNDVDPSVPAWFRDRGSQFSSHQMFDANGSGDKNDTAYLLTNDRGEKRVIVITDGTKTYDAHFPQATAIARVSKDAMEHLKWGRLPPTGVKGDGLLLIRDAADPASGLIFYLNQGRIVSSSPENWQAVPISSD